MKDKVIEDLLNLRDDKYRLFTEKLCPGTSNIIGVRIPLLRKYAKNMLKLDYLDYLNNPSSSYYETIMLEGILIAYSKIKLEDKFKYLDVFIPKIDNWAICDTVCNSFKLKDEDLDIMFNYLSSYSKSKDEFTLRFILVMFLNNYLCPKYIDKVLAMINNMYTGSYYVDMAIAWLLSFVYIDNKDKFFSFLDKTKLSKDILKKSFRKIIESNKVSSSEKDMVRKLSNNF